MKDAVDLVNREIAAVRNDLGGMRKDVGRLAEVDILDRETSAKENERFYTALSTAQKSIDTVQTSIEVHIKEVPVILQKHQEDTIKLIEGKLPCL